MINLLRSWIMNALGFSKSEANGTLVILCVVCLVVIIPRILLSNTKQSPESFAADRESLRQWASELEAPAIADNPPTIEVVPAAAQSFPFDPNEATEDQFMALGFSTSASRNILRYREKGGKFRVKADLRRIYGISQERIDALWPVIQLPEVIILTENSNTPAKSPETSHLEIDLNTATPEELEVVRGIGPVLSKRIVSFREKLGGYYSTSQLYEVYGLDSSVTEALKQHVIISGYIKKISINTDSVESLSRHPYINRQIAQAIVRYRMQHGNYESIDQLKSIKIMSDSLYQKLYPYLSLNP